MKIKYYLCKLLAILLMSMRAFAFELQVTENNIELTVSADEHDQVTNVCKVSTPDIGIQATSLQGDIIDAFRSIRPNISESDLLKKQLKFYIVQNGIRT